MLVSLDDIISKVRLRSRDTNSSRWSDEEIAYAVSTAVAGWAGRVGFYRDSGEFVYQSVPTSSISLAQAVSTDDDAEWKVNGIDEGFSGHVRFGTDIVQFDGVKDGVLLNAVRDGSSAHQINDPGAFMIYYDDPELMDVLIRTSMAIASMMFVTDGSPESTQAHQWQSRFQHLRSDRFWHKYTPALKYTPKVKT